MLNCYLLAFLVVLRIRSGEMPGKVKKKKGKQGKTTGIYARTQAQPFGFSLSFPFTSLPALSSSFWGISGSSRRIRRVANFLFVGFPKAFYARRSFLHKHLTGQLFSLSFSAEKHKAGAPANRKFKRKRAKKAFRRFLRK